VQFRSVFIAVVIGSALIIGAFLVNNRRPSVETQQPDAAFVRASGKCAECHSQQQYSVVHEYEMSAHARKESTAWIVHAAAENQQKKEHHGFTITTRMTAGNCRSCHDGVYQEFLRRPPCSDFLGGRLRREGLTPQQVSFAEQYHPGYAKRPPHPFVTLEGGSAMASGCDQCHAVGRPNDDGSVGTCTACHARHTSSVGLARLPTTCGQCHLGPDHSQIEIYEESKHGMMFAAQEHLLNLNASPKALTTRDIFVPTCATCHMSGLNGLKVTHDPSDRLSYYLADAVTSKRPNYAVAQANMKQVCNQCHTKPLIDRVYQQAEKVVVDTNDRVRGAQDIVNSLRKDGLLAGKPFTNPIDFVYFDFWHYDGRTAKHGAFMGGADFVQWHGNYPMLRKLVELRAMSDELRKKR
jgi:hypothetical protein